MNILFVTENTPDAGLIERELTGLIPDLHLAVSLDVQEAIGLSTVPGRFSAVLLDSVLNTGDPLAIIRALRARNAPIAIIGLAAPTDPASVVKFMEAGADDYVFKRTGFVGTLAAIVQRACGRYDSAKDGKSSPGVPSASEGAETPRESATPAMRFKPAPIRRDTTGATSFLLRNVSEPTRARKLKIERDAFLKALRASNTNRIKLKQQLRAAEEERCRLQEGVQALESRLAHQAEEFRAEREQSDLWRVTLKQRLAAVEHSRATIEQMVLLERPRQEQPSGHYFDYASRIENTRQELEQERRRAEKENARLRASLHAAEAQIGSQAERQRAQQEQWESMRLVLEQQRQDLESRVVALEEARRALELKYRESLAHAQKSRPEPDH